MQQADAPAAVAPPAADTQALDRGIAAPAPAAVAAPAATAAAASELIDLLSMEDTAAPAAPVAEQPQAAVTDSDGML